MIKKVSVRGYDFEVDFDYQPYEPSTRHYPGCSEDVEINEVMDSDGDIIKEYAFELLEYNLMEACLNAVHEDQDRVTDAQLLRAENRADLRHETQHNMDGLVTQINRSTDKITEIRQKIRGKTVDELIKEFSNEPTL